LRLLTFICPNRDFSMGYERFKQKNFPCFRLCVRRLSQPHLFCSTSNRSATGRRISVRRGEMYNVASWFSQHNVGRKLGLPLVRRLAAAEFAGLEIRPTTGCLTCATVGHAKPRAGRADAGLTSAFGWGAGVGARLGLNGAPDRSVPLGGTLFELVDPLAGRALVRSVATAPAHEFARTAS
jgi:hypothetical protein